MKIKNVLSLFNGMSCGVLALQQAGISFEKYYASEIDKYANKIAEIIYPDTIFLGSVTDINTEQLPAIDLLIGGSPCQSFSFSGKRNGMTTKCSIEITTLEQYLELKENNFEFEGQSYLFWEFVRILQATNPKYFLLENVMMEEKWELLISKTLGVHPVMINSALVSAQNRKRLYWTNIGLAPSGFFGDLESTIQQPKDKGLVIKDIIENDVDEKYYLSDKLINYFMENSSKNKSKGNGFRFSPTDGGGKGKSLTTLSGSRMDDNFLLND